MIIHRELTGFEKKWKAVLLRLKDQFGKVPDLNAILLLIGIQEIGMIKDKFTKEEKEDLMHVAICTLLSKEGYFEYIGKDEDGWPHWKPVKNIPKVDLKKQEILLKKHIIDYFE